jgi:hypothetical protein
MALLSLFTYFIVSELKSPASNVGLAILGKLMDQPLIICDIQVSDADMIASGPTAPFRFASMGFIVGMLSHLGTYIIEWIPRQARFVLEKVRVPMGA